MHTYRVFTIFSRVARVTVARVIVDFVDARSTIKTRSVFTLIYLYTRRVRVLYNINSVG